MRTNERLLIEKQIAELHKQIMHRDSGPGLQLAATMLAVQMQGLLLKADFHFGNRREEEANDQHSG